VPNNIDKLIYYLEELESQHELTKKQNISKYVININSDDEVGVRRWNNIFIIQNKRQSRSIKETKNNWEQ
jgi:hypothetical protein